MHCMAAWCVASTACRHGPMTLQVDGEQRTGVTPCFSQNNINPRNYLNKSYHLMHSCHCIFYFWLICALVFYFVIRSRQNSNLVRIQIDLKFIKDLEKKRRFSIFPSLMGRNSATHRLGAASQPSRQTSSRLCGPVAGPAKAQCTSYRGSIRAPGVNPLHQPVSKDLTQ
jgi:hypothetical protein